MPERKIEQAEVLRQEQIAPGIYDLLVKTNAAEKAVCGQFVSLYCHDKTKLLPRPISICGIDRNRGTLRLVYRVTGRGTGTDELAGLQAKDRVRLLGPLGNGFPVVGDSPLLIGGGIGVPPMLELAKELKKTKKTEKISVVLGYRDSRLFLKDEFEAYAKVFVATDDGSVGTKGTVIDAVKEHAVEADVIYACGPKPMLRAVKEYAQEQKILCYVSMEERMACGVGACLGCVCQTTGTDTHSHVKNARVCKDGPVFLAQEVEL